MNPLHNIHLLITRPQPQAQKSAQALQASGVQSTVLPVLRIEAICEADSEYKRAKELIKAVQAYQQLIFISVNAVHAAFKLAAQQHIELSSIAGHCWAIGQATQQALKEYGIEAGCTHGTENSEALLAEPQLQVLAQQKVLIFRGVGGRKHLAEVLAQRGARVDYCECYRRVAIRPATGQLNDYFAATMKDTTCSAVILMLSIESLDAFEDYAEQEQMLSRVRQTAILVPSRRVETEAKRRGYQHLINSEGASFSKLQRALQLYVAR